MSENNQVSKHSPQTKPSECETFAGSKSQEECIGNETMSLKQDNQAMMKDKTADTNAQVDKIIEEVKEWTQMRDVYPSKEDVARLSIQKALATCKDGFFNIINECSTPVMDEEAMEKFIEDNQESSVYRLVNFDKLRQRLKDE